MLLGLVEQSVHGFRCANLAIQWQVFVFAESVFTAVPNLIGSPALVTKGVQLMGKNYSEKTLLSIADMIERMGE